jgi:hypothetical protein
VQALELQQGANVQLQLARLPAREVPMSTRDTDITEGIDNNKVNLTIKQRRNTMAYDEEEARQSRVVVETPTARREVVNSQSVRTPDRNGISAGMVGVLVVVAIALITLLVLFWMSTQPTADQNANTVAQQPPPPTVVQQAPAQQPPVIIQQPAPATQQAPIIIQSPSGGTADTSASNNDANVQMAIDKQLTEDPTFSTLGITATVMNAKVTLLGTVKTEAMKNQVEKMVRKTKGVKEVDNQISVIAD